LLVMVYSPAQIAGAYFAGHNCSAPVRVEG
jgi:hypothetical protein